MKTQNSISTVAVKQIGHSDEVMERWTWLWNSLMSLPPARPHYHQWHITSPLSTPSVSSSTLHQIRWDCFMLCFFFFSLMGLFWWTEYAAAIAAQRLTKTCLVSSGRKEQMSDINWPSPCIWFSSNIKKIKGSGTDTRVYVGWEDVEGGGGGVWVSSSAMQGLWETYELISSVTLCAHTGQVWLKTTNPPEGL